MELKNIVLVFIILVSIVLGCIGDKPNLALQTGKNRVATIVTEKGTIKFELYDFNRN